MAVVEQTKIEAVKGYFRRAFPECDIDARWDGWTFECWCHITLSDGTEMPKVRITYDFFSKRTPEEIATKLSALRLAEQLQSSAGRSLLVRDTDVALLAE